MRLSGKTALVTGANRGIGFELCRQLAAEGAKVFMASRRKASEALRALTSVGYAAENIEMDVSDRNSITQAIKNIPEPVDILINNAAILDRGDLFSLTDQEIDNIIRTNLLGPMLLCKYFGRQMRERGWGRIVNITSGMGAISRGLGGESVAYRVTKLALNGLTISLAASLRNTGVLVNSVDPGWVKTSMGGSMAPRSPEEGAKSILYAVYLSDHGPTGFFFRDGRKVDF
jgi:NAD(P)-dependent dehydrogenase (short-subunit alcohol dehydrogenase family)